MWRVIDRQPLFPHFIWVWHGDHPHFSKSVACAKDQASRVREGKSSLDSATGMLFEQESLSDSQASVSLIVKVKITISWREGLWLLNPFRYLNKLQPQYPVSPGMTVLWKWRPAYIPASANICDLIDHKYCFHAGYKQSTMPDLRRAFFIPVRMQSPKKKKKKNNSREKW